MKRRKLTKELLSVLACPVCKGHVILKSNIKESSDFLYCGQCNQKYSICDGVPDMLPPEVRIPPDEHGNNVSLSIKQVNMSYGYRYYREWERDKWLANPASICGTPPLQDFVLTYLNRPKMKVLDCCSGMGVTASPLVDRGLKMFCFDISRDSIAALAKHHTNISNKFVADAENMPILENSFDGVLFYAALHHLPNPRKALEESFRVLKDGGRVILLEPNSRNTGIASEVTRAILRTILRPSRFRKDVALVYNKVLAKTLKKTTARYEGKDYTIDSDGRWLAFDEMDQEISLPYVLQLAKMTGFKVLNVRTKDFALAVLKFLKKDISVETWRKSQRIDQMFFERIPFLNKYGEHMLIALQK